MRPVPSLARGRDFARRISQVILVASRYGFGHTVDRLGLSRFAPKGQRRAAAEADRVGLAAAVRVRMALEELGPTYIKLGQALASRADLFPEEFVTELRKLQDEVPPIPFDQAREVVEGELGARIDDLWETFESEPAASASIGQVHHGTLKSGEEVAVKVQRPGIEQVVEVDLNILRTVAQLAERRFLWAERSDLVGLVEEFAENLRGELVYTTEGHNADRLRENLKDEEGIYVPRTFWALTTDRVLTSERLVGVKPTDEDGMAEMGVDRPRLATRVGRSMLRQILLDGFFHADPHTGNLLVVGPARAAFVDFGSMGWLGRELREELLRLLVGLLEEEAGVVCEQLVNIGAIGPDTDLQSLERELDVLVAKYRHIETGEVKFSRIINRLMSLLCQYQIRMPSEFALLMKALVLTEGLCQVIDPEFDFRKVAEPFARRSLEMPSPRAVAEELVRVARDLRHYARLLPKQVTQLLSKLESGNLKVRVDYDRMEEPLGRFDVIANRLAYAMIVSAIVIASALLAQSQRPVEMFGVNVPLGVIGFVMAAVMGLWLVWAIVQSGRI
ncbi:MAG: ABC1 kinase family protein [Armatimonadota bacterium]